MSSLERVIRLNHAERWQGEVYLSPNCKFKEFRAPLVLLLLRDEFNDVVRLNVDPHAAGENLTEPS